jgi:hypothetical protein
MTKAKKEHVKEEKKENFSLNEFLANFSSNSRNIDKVIVKWYQKKDPKNTKRNKEEWENLIKEFFSQTER